MTIALLVRLTNTLDNVVGALNTLDNVVVKLIVLLVLLHLCFS